MLPRLVRVPAQRDGPGDDQRDYDRLKRRMAVPARIDPVATRRLSEEQMQNVEHWYARTRGSHVYLTLAGVWVLAHGGDSGTCLFIHYFNCPQLVQRLCRGEGGKGGQSNGGGNFSRESSSAAAGVN